MSNNIPLKTQAHSLKKYLKEKGIDLKLGHAYEAIANIHGYPNWDTCVASYKMPAEKWKIDINKIFDYKRDFKFDSSKWTELFSSFKYTRNEELISLFNDENLNASYATFIKAKKDGSSAVDCVIDDIRNLQIILEAANLEYDRSYDLDTFSDDLRYLDEEEDKEEIKESLWTSDMQFMCDELLWSKRRKQIIYKKYTADFVKEFRFSSGNKEYFFDGDQTLILEIPLIEAPIDIQQKIHPRLPEFLDYVTKTLATKLSKSKSE
jgi:hypothetical protein